MEKKEKAKYIFRAIKKKVKLSYLLLLIALLAGNTYAWFIYHTQVQNSIDVHVRAWNIVLSQSNSPIYNYVNFKVDNIYPGMTDYTDSIDVYNQSEVPAGFKYTILSADVLGTKYVTEEGREANNENILPNDMTSYELEELLADYYPFKITFSLTDDNLNASNGRTNYAINVSWDYESGNDALDTYYGNLAYDYMQSHQAATCIQINIKIEVYQTNAN